MLVRETGVMTQKLDRGVFQEASLCKCCTKAEKGMSNDFRFVIRNVMKAE